MCSKQIRDKYEILLNTHTKKREKKKPGKKCRDQSQRFARESILEPDWQEAEQGSYDTNLLSGRIIWEQSAPAILSKEDKAEKTPPHEDGPQGPSLKLLGTRKLQVTRFQQRLSKLLQESFTVRGMNPAQTGFQIQWKRPEKQEW